MLRVAVVFIGISQFVLITGGDQGIDGVAPEAGPRSRSHEKWGDMEPINDQQALASSVKSCVLKRILNRRRNHRKCAATKSLSVKITTPCKRHLFLLCNSCKN
jgi:hypothetical protein